MKSFAALFSLAAAAATVSARTFTVKNNCPYTVWPAIFTDLNVAPNTPSQPTGWQADPHTSVSFQVPNNWKSGRIWGRRNCNFSNGANSCITGQCNGGLHCDPHSGVGATPATLAEFTLSLPGSGALDFYDVSLVDGFNLPIRIQPSKGCHVADCPVDLNAICPSQLRGPVSGGTTYGCKTFCAIDSNQGNSPACCTGSHSIPSTCPPSGVPYYSFFKNNCPNSYAYAYDESSGTALWTCDANVQADYTITFCP